MKRLRKIAYIGGMYYIRLSRIDVKDFKLKINQEVDISDLNLNTEASQEDF